MTAPKVRMPGFAAKGKPGLFFAYKLSKNKRETQINPSEELESIVPAGYHIVGTPIACVGYPAGPAAKTEKKTIKKKETKKKVVAQKTPKKTQTREEKTNTTVEALESVLYHSVIPSYAKVADMGGSLAFVPDIVLYCQKKLHENKENVWDALRSLSKKQKIQLRQESGINLLTKEEIGLCLPTLDWRTGKPDPSQHGISWAMLMAEPHHVDIIPAKSLIHTSKAKTNPTTLETLESLLFHSVIPSYAQVANMGGRLAFIPDIVLYCQKKLHESKENVWDALRSLSKKQKIQLQQESGIGLLTKEEAALAVPVLDWRTGKPDPSQHGLSWAMIMAEPHHVDILPAKSLIHTSKAKTNPTASATRTLEQVWKIWTGAKPGQKLKIPVDRRGDCPLDVVMLGRITKLITAKGDVKAFEKDGPFLVTDEEMKAAWLVDVEARHFDLNLRGGIIAYTAKKAKFGDRGPVEYVHAFDGTARALMAGQVGKLTGSFKLTPRGIEG